MLKEDDRKVPTLDCANDNRGIYYFAYGPMTNSVVRQRRGIQATVIRAAYLPEHGLSFAVGGLASIVPRRGYDVHGILLKLESEEAWQRVQEFDAGSISSIREVIPYHEGYCVDDADTPVPYQKPVRAHVLTFSDQVERQSLDTQTKKGIPSERYLKLIEQGLTQHNVDSDYISGEIMAIGFLPKKGPENFERIPHRQKSLPKIRFKKYLALCKKGDGKKIYFILQDGIYRTIKEKEVDFEDPAARWFQRNGHGKADCSFQLHRLVVDPDMVPCEDSSELSSDHFDWIENHIVELTRQCNFQCEKVAILKKEGGGMTRRMSSNGSLVSFFRSNSRRRKRNSNSSGSLMGLMDDDSSSSSSSDDDGGDDDNGHISNGSSLTMSSTRSLRWGSSKSLTLSATSQQALRVQLEIRKS